MSWMPRARSCFGGGALPTTSPRCPITSLVGDVPMGFPRSAAASSFAGVPVMQRSRSVSQAFAAG